MPPRGHGMYRDKKKIGSYGPKKVEEDGGVNLGGGLVVDAETQRVRKLKSPRWDSKAKRWR